MIPDVDVVVLSWERRDDTLETLRSVLSQEEVSVTLWVVDQGSSPDQVAELRSLANGHSNVRLVEVGSNIGVPAGRNLGMGRGRAEWVVCLDNDAVFASSLALSRAAEQLTSSSRVGAVAFRAEEYLSGDVDPTTWVYPPQLAHHDETVPVSRFVGVGHALRRAAFEAAGGYDERLFFCEEELDLSYKLIGLGYHILYDPGIVVRHKVSPEVRMRWDDGRTYYQTRNAVLVHHRHHRTLPGTLSRAGGWLVRAGFNRELGQAVRGIRDAARLWRAGGDEWPPLGREARRYIDEHDTRHRGSWLRRLRREVLVGLPTGRHTGDQP